MSIIIRIVIVMVCAYVGSLVAGIQFAELKWTPDIGPNVKV